MLILIIVVIAIVVISYLIKNKVVIRLDTFIHKGIHLQKDVYGVYCFCR